MVAWKSLFERAENQGKRLWWQIRASANWQQAHFYVIPLLPPLIRPNLKRRMKHFLHENLMLYRIAPSTNERAIISYVVRINLFVLLRTTLSSKLAICVMKLVVTFCLSLSLSCSSLCDSLLLGRKDSRLVHKLRAIGVGTERREIRQPFIKLLLINYPDSAQRFARAAFLSLLY